MIHYEFGHDKTVEDWVCSLIGLNPFTDNPLTMGFYQGDEIVAGVLFNNYDPGCNIEVHVAALPGVRWLSRTALHDAFAYPFIQLGLPRVSARIDANNRKSLKLNLGLGFKAEGAMRKAAKDGGDVVVLGMLKEECGWING